MRYDREREKEGGEGERERGRWVFMCPNRFKKCQSRVQEPKQQLINQTNQTNQINWTNSTAP